MTTTTDYTIRYAYNGGKTDYFTLLSPTGEELHFAGQVPVHFARKYAERILTCENCLHYGFWGGTCIGMCTNCGLDTGAQRGFANYGQECDWESRAHLPSVFDKGQYLHKDWDLKRVGDKFYKNTIHIMVNELHDYLLNEFGTGKLEAVFGVCDYLRSLDHEPREAIMRINEVWHIPKEQLYNRNWTTFFGPHFDENGDYIGSDIDTNADTEDDDEDNQGPLTSASFAYDHLSRTRTRPVLTRTDTVIHNYRSQETSDNDDNDNNDDYHNYDNDTDAVSEISECGLTNLNPEQPDQVINDVGNTA